MATKKKTTKAKLPAAKLSTRHLPGSTAPKRTPRTASVEEIGGMTVREAGRKGGLIGGRKGGLTVKAERGIKFFQRIGRLGGQRVRDLIAAGRKATEKQPRRRHT